MYRIIVDSGATKADWCALSDSGVSLSVKSPGMNLATMPMDAVASIVCGAVSELGVGAGEVSGVYFYAAGLLSGSESAEELTHCLKSIFPSASIECNSDLLAAARAVCGTEKGVAAILGTGSNSCLYDGERIVRNVRSGGFILGDEGGGACLGKLFMSDYLKGLVPEDLASEFGAEFQADYMTVVTKVYREAAPSAYLGSFAPWILSHASSSAYAEGLVKDNLRNFVRRSLKQYSDVSSRVGIVGGFACACESCLREVAREEGIDIIRIIPTPMQGLTEYHKW